MAFILGQFKLEEFGLRPACEYASRKLQFLEAHTSKYRKDDGIGEITNSNVSVESDTVQQTLGAPAKQRATDAFPATVTEVKAAIASVEEKYGPELTPDLKRDAKPALAVVFKQLVDAVIKAEYDRWEPELVSEVKRFLKNIDGHLPMMAIDRDRADHISSICAQVVERDTTVRSNGAIFYQLLSMNISQLKWYVAELEL